MVVGHAGFHLPPDASGTVEIGYTIAPDHRGQGYATELVRGLLDFARARGVRTVQACTAPDNVASQAVLARAGFAFVEEVLDDVDGPELLHAVTLTDAPHGL